MSLQKVEEVSKLELVLRYIERQDATEEATLTRMSLIEDVREVTGWFLLECAALDSSKLGERTLLPYGPGCTFKAPPRHPVSPRGLASDMAVVVAISTPETK